MSNRRRFLMMLSGALAWPRFALAQQAERTWHPWLRINRVLRAMLHTRWSSEAWPQVKAEFTKALALRSRIRRAGWFN